MQVGFLAFETGSGRAKNVRNILLKNLLDVMLAALVWWALGFGLAYGTSAKGFIGCAGGCPQPCLTTTSMIARYL
jgi:Amt family ammonium transporter